jgi:hypothetical protein
LKVPLTICKLFCDVTIFNICPYPPPFHPMPSPFIRCNPIRNTTYTYGVRQSSHMVNIHMRMTPFLRPASISPLHQCPPGSTLTSSHRCSDSDSDSHSDSHSHSHSQSQSQSQFHSHSHCRSRYLLLECLPDPKNRSSSEAGQRGETSIDASQPVGPHELGKCYLTCCLGLLLIK